MSNAHLTAAWKTPTPDAQSKLVLARLADAADKTGVCWPQVDRIAEETCLSEATIYRKLAVLETARLLTRDRFRKGKSDRVKYTLHLCPSPSQPARVKESPSPSHCERVKPPLTLSACEGETEVHPLTLRASPSQPASLTLSACEGAYIGEPSKNPHSTQTNARATTTDDWDLPVTRTNADEITALKSNLNGLHPDWKKRPHFTAAEDRELFDNRTPWLRVEASDWELLTAYMHVLIPDDWRQNPRDLFQPDNRLAIIRMGPTAILGHADRWKRECVKRNVPTGLKKGGAA